jgi:hypothetical protein
MGISRARLRAIEHRSDDVESFLLKNGRRFYYNRQEASIALFMYGVTTIDEDAEAPEFIRIVLEEAKDPRAVLETFRSGNPSKMFFDPLDLLEDTS